MKTAITDINKATSHTFIIVHSIYLTINFRSARVVDKFNWFSQCPINHRRQPLSVKQGMP